MIALARFAKASLQVIFMRIVATNAGRGMNALPPTFYRVYLDALRANGGHTYSQSR